MSIGVAKGMEREVLEPTEFFQVGKEGEGLRVYLHYRLFRALDDFAVRDTSSEQSGLLVGSVHWDGESGFVLVEDAIEMGSYEGEEVLSARGLQYAERIAKSRYKGKQIVGWFHTHPGCGLELTEREIDVHSEFFTEPWQVVYIVDAVAKDRNFHCWREGKLMAASGFRIYGKESAVNMDEPSRLSKAVTTDERLRERYLERSLDKIQRMLRRPAVQVKDIVIIALLLVNLVLILVRPGGRDMSLSAAGLSGQREMSQKLDAIQVRIDRLEKHLAALEVLDQEISLESSTGKKNDGQTVSTDAVAVDNNEVADSGSVVGRAVRLYRVQEGDTLSTIAERYYKSSAPKLVAALGKYNRLQGPNYAIYPGQTVKIPDRANLKL